MIKAVIHKASVLKKIITVLNNLFHMVSLCIDENILNILMITTCDSMLFDIKLELDEIEFNSDIHHFTFSVNAKHFLESFNTLRANDSVTIFIDTDNMIIETVSNEKTERAYLSISLTQTLNVCPEPCYDDEIEVKNVNFPKLCKALSNASRELILRGNSRRITLRANLEKLYSREVEFGDHSCTHNDFEEIYLAEHFLDVSKISNLNNNLIFKAKAEQPLCIEARLSGKSTFKVFIKSSIDSLSN